MPFPLEPTYFLRVATTGDLPVLRELIPISVRALSQEHYTPRQIESAIRYVFGPDTQLIADGTYFVTETAGRIVGCGGWSRRRTLYGGDQMKSGEGTSTDDDLLDPATDAARIRAFFVHPDWARRGVATHLLEACLEAARTAGFRRATLGATLPGVAFYRRWGFAEERPLPTTLPDGTAIAFVEMSAMLDDSTPD